MKLNNIIIALCALFAFTACSDDEANSITSKKEVKGTLTVKAATKASTKNDPHELAGEAQIHNITAFVFDAETDELIGLGQQEYDDVSHECTIENIPLWRIDVEAKVILVANAMYQSFQNAEDVGVEYYYEDVYNILASITAQTQEHLTMSSKAEPAYVAKETIISKLFILTRIAARLQATNASTNFATDSKSVYINYIYFGNAKTQSRFFNEEEEWGAVEVANSEILDKFDDFIVRMTLRNGTSVPSMGYYVYTMENTDQNTPTSFYANVTYYDGEVRGETVTLSAPVDFEEGIRRNYVYEVSFSFSDPSDDDPEYGALSVKVDVKDWYLLEENHVIEDED